MVDGDWVFNEATGRPVELEGTEKLRQDVRMNLSMDTQVDGTGADLDGLIGLLLDPISLRAEVSKRVVESFDAWRTLQRTIQAADRSKEEKIARVARVQTTSIRTPGSNEVEKTSYAFSVDVLSEKANEGPISVVSILRRPT